MKGQSVDIYELAQLIKKTALLTGEFTLSSGRKSNYYLDKYRIETQPAILDAVADGFVPGIPTDTERLAGPELGAIPLVTTVGLKTGIPFLLVRKKVKEYGTKNMGFC